MAKKDYRMESGSLFDQDAVKSATKPGSLEDTLFGSTPGSQHTSKPVSQQLEKARPKRGRPEKDAKPPETKKATYYIDREIVRALNIFSAEKERSASDIVTEALRTYLRKHGKEV